MERSATVISIGAVFFGLSVGYITYRTLVRKEGAAITDIAGVVAAIGGGAVTTRFDNDQGDSFAYYSIGLFFGLALYYLQFRLTNSKERASQLLGDQVEAAADVPAPPDTVSADDLQAIRES